MANSRMAAATNALRRPVASESQPASRLATIEATV